MAIPNYQRLMLPVLRVAQDGREHSVSDFRAQVALELKLSDEELTQRVPSGEGLFSNRIRWALQYLKAAGVLNTIRRATYQITERGSDLLKGSPSEITVANLRQFHEFAESFQRDDAPGSKPIVVDVSNPLSDLQESTITPEESLETNFASLRQSLANDLLDAIKNGTPAAFEQIVVDLLVAMGYGGSVEDTG